MGLQVVQGAMLQCTFGAAPATLAVVSQAQISSSKMLAATIMDFAPMANIPPFGMCSAPSNPQVIAALGSPVPCVPVIPAPWAPGSPTLTLQKLKALNNSCKCNCTWGGVISVTMPGQTTETIP